MSAAFVDIGRNRNGLTPTPAKLAGDDCLHAGVVGQLAAGFSRERGHPVYPVRLPAQTVSMSVGELAPGACT